MAEVKRTSLVKPTVDTPFHIDFSWWKQNDREWSVYLRGLLGAENAEKLAEREENEQLDWVDPQTAEVKRVDALQYMLMSQFANHDDQVPEGTSLVEAIFQTFLRNGNTPLTAQQLGKALDRPANTILRTLSGKRVYRGIRPIPE